MTSYTYLFHKLYNMCKTRSLCSYRSNNSCLIFVILIIIDGAFCNFNIKTEENYINNDSSNIKDTFYTKINKRSGTYTAHVAGSEESTNNFNSIHKTDRYKKAGTSSLLASAETGENKSSFNLMEPEVLYTTEIVDNFGNLIYTKFYTEFSKENIGISNLTDAAVNIANNEFDPEQITIVMWTQNDTVDVNKLLMKYPGSVITAPIQNTSTTIVHNLYFNYRVTQTIFVTSTPQNFEYLAQIIKKDVVISPRTILILMDPINNKSQLTEATKAAWKNDIGDIVIINTEAETKEVKLWTYLPYGNGECENYTALPLDTRTGFYPRKYKNFYGCPIRVTLLHFVPYVLLEKENDTVLSISGIDGQALNLVMEKLNASFDIISSIEHGGIGTFINGSGTGSFGDLVNGIADIFSPAIMITDLRYPRAQISYVYETLDAYLCGPNQREIYAWAKVLLPFFSNISPFIGVSFVVFVVATKVIRRYALCQPERKRGIFFMAFVMFLGQEVNFETKCWLVNSLFVLWIWFCMIVRIGYQGDLVDGLQSMILEPPLGTFDEAVEKLQGYGGVEGFQRYYRNTSREEKYQVLSLEDIPNYIKEIGEGKRFLLATDIELVKWFGVSLQVLEEPLSRAAACLHMRAGWPAGHEVRSITFNIAETGLIEKILDDFQYERLLHSLSDQAEVREAQQLDMATLGACFYGLLVMCGVCFAIFCVEIICYKYELKSKLKRKFKVK